MKKSTFLNLLNTGHERMTSLTKSKGEEYSSSDDQLGNFRRLAEQTGLTMPQIWLVLFTKHLDAIRTFVKDEAAGVTRTRSEPIEGRIDDAILYLYLLRAIVAKEEAPVATKTVSAPAPAPKAAPPSTIHFGTAFTNAPQASLVNAAMLEVPGGCNYQYLNHPDSLHGVGAGGAFVWVGPLDDRAREYHDKCVSKGIEFHVAPLGEYADDKFGGK